MTDIFDPATVVLYMPKLLSKLPITLSIVAGAWLVGTMLGLVLACVRLYRIPVLNQATALVSAMLQTMYLQEGFYYDELKRRFKDRDGDGGRDRTEMGHGRSRKWIPEMATPSFVTSLPVSGSRAFPATFPRHPPRPR